MGFVIVANDLDDQPTERWNSEFATWLIGKYILVGITTIKSKTNEVIEQVQVHGIVNSAEKRQGIRIACEGVRKGTDYMLPPDTAAFSPSAEGIYRLYTTNEEIDSPDAIATWEIFRTD